MKYIELINSLSIPWMEGPFAVPISKELCRDVLSDDLDAAAAVMGYRAQGILVVNDLGYDDSFYERICHQILEHSKTLPKQEDGYHYNESPRVFEAWRTIPEVLDLARNPKIIKLLKMLYGREPKPFQTINFIKGSSQPLHQDSIHFYTQPERWMVGVWTALEDIHIESGPLVVVPGSHRLPHYSFQDLKLEKPAYGQQFEAYRVYEQFIRDLISVHPERFETREMLLKKGQSVIWAANLLHGGAPILNPSLTRYSQATHYYFEGCNHYYSPMFSNACEGDYAEKDLSTKDILNHIIKNA